MLSYRRDFIEKTLQRLTGSMEQAERAESTGSGRGMLQRLDPRVKLAGFLGLICAAAASRHLPATGAIFAIGLLLAGASGGAVLRAVARLWAGIFVFTGAVVLPALFLTPGAPVFRLPGAGFPVTDHGLHSAASLLARAETTATLAALMVLTTRWAHLLKALRLLRVPALAVVLLGMTYRFIFVLLGIARDAFEARRARQVGRLAGRQRRQMAVSSAAMLLSKSVQLSGAVYEAMQARGFRGEAATLDEFRMGRRDWGMAALFLTLALAALEWGCR